MRLIDAPIIGQTDDGHPREHYRSAKISGVLVALPGSVVVSGASVVVISRKDGNNI